MIYLIYFVFRHTHTLLLVLCSLWLKIYASDSQC